jgi:hypothetical protein
MTAHSQHRESTDFVEQRLGNLQVRGLEALCEPAVDRCEEVVSLRATAQVTPQSGKAGRGAQLERFRLLIAGDLNRPSESCFCGCLVSAEFGEQEIASHAVRDRLPATLLAAADISKASSTASRPLLDRPAEPSASARIAR